MESKVSCEAMGPDFAKLVGNGSLSAFESQNSYSSFE